MRFRRWSAVLAVFVLMVASIAASRPTDANDAPGCDGLATYRKETFKAAREYIAAFQPITTRTGSNPFSMTKDDFQTLETSVDKLITEFKTITPPAFAKPWQDAEITYLGISQQIYLAAIEGGVYATIPFTDASTKALADREAAVKEVSKSCSDFTVFSHDWDALDGDINGTPVATPTD